MSRQTAPNSTPSGGGGAAIQYDRRRLLLALDAYLRTCFEVGTVARVGELAMVIGVSRPHLSRLYRSVIGSTIGELMRERQVRRAEHLLRTTDMKMADVAQLSAFGTDVTLRRAFVALRGVTPGQYREEETK